MNVIINKEEYVSSDILFEKAPIYCKLVRSARELIRKNKLTSYIFLKLVDKKWTVSDGKSYKFDKVYFKKIFIDTIPEFNQEKIIIDKINIELAPDIINLDDNEKFKDDNGTIIEIETRGERKVDSIYFKVKDVMIGFKMENLLTTIIDKRKDGYIDGIHYKYFNCLKKGIITKKQSKIKKELFLTYKGFYHVAYLSRNKCMSNNLYTIKKWLDTFDKTILNNYTINIKDSIIQNKIGYVYIVSSNLLDAVKIGMWRSSIEALYSRYNTCYGKNIHIDYFLTSNARELESKTHKYFKKYQITNELFNKLYYTKYYEFIETNIDEINDELFNNDTIDYSDISDDTTNLYEVNTDNMSIISNITDIDNILTTTEIYDINYIELQKNNLLLKKQVEKLTKLLANKI
jgi:hypothetical protein